MPPKTYAWESEPIFDPKHGWVFIEYQAPGDRSNRNPKKKPLAPWQLDQYGQPLPGSSPHVELISAGRHDATPRTDPLVDPTTMPLVTGMRDLSLHHKGIDSNSYQDTSPDEHLLTQSPPNYHHSLQDQGDLYGTQESYVGPSDTASGKGKGRVIRSGSGKEGSQSSRHNSNTHRRNSHKRPSSSKASNFDPDEVSQLQEREEFHYPSSSQETILPYATGGDSTYPYRMSGLPTSSPYGLPSVSETEPLPTDYSVDDTLTEEGRYQPYGSEVNSYSYSHTNAAPSLPSSMDTTPRGPSSSSRRYGNNNRSPFAVHHAKEFTVGKVFKLRWCEPKGNQGPIGINGSQATEAKLVGPSQISNRSESSWFWEGFRRFIVVRVFKSHCFAVPIYTYGNQGCRKPGCKPEYHGIVHDAKRRPEQLQGEPKLGFPPIRIRMKHNDSLLSASRANYFGSTTVQYNLDVVFVGEVIKEDLDKLNKAVQTSYTGN